MFTNFSHNFLLRLTVFIIMTIAITVCFMLKQWSIMIPVILVWIYVLYKILLSDRRNAHKVSFLLEAVDNGDYSFHYSTDNGIANDQMVNGALNRITQILLQAKADAIQQEKYYELILNSINTGIIVLDEKGNIFQTNNEAMRLLGLNIFTNVHQLSRIDPILEERIVSSQPGVNQQVSFNNERGTVHLAIRVAGMTLKDKEVRILAINDIHSELEENEIESWIRLTRVLTHEIMNSVTPITSLSDTLLNLHKDTPSDVRDGLEVISSTGKSLISFVESYRKFTHIPTPSPELFYVKKFANKLAELSYHHFEAPNIIIDVNVEPEDLIVYADENLISQVVLNLLKNAMQAIPSDKADGQIILRAYCTKEEAVIIEVSDNGKNISAEEAEHIFIPFFTTKEGGSGIGLSVSKQIMRLSGGSIELVSAPDADWTTFRLTFP